MILSCVDEPELSTKSAKQCISDVYSIPEMDSGTFGGDFLRNPMSWTTELSEVISEVTF